MGNNANAQHPNWIPLTKVIPPQLGDDILPRPKVAGQLYRAIMEKRLTLISAPAGSGKTVLAASLRKTSPDLPLVWLALDEDDNAPITFMWSVLTSLRRRFPEAGRDASMLLAELPNPAGEIRRIQGVLINEVLAIDPPTFAFVIDDYHVIDNPTIHEAVEYFLGRLPPPMRLVIATRRKPPLPLARLRARGQLAQLDSASLRFESDDVRILFQDRLSLPLPPDTIEMLESGTDGWIAGLRLLASRLKAIEGTARRHAFVEQFAGTDRHVFDLLAEEVLQRQPKELQQLLLQTSILRELTPSMCQAVTAREDAADLLAEAVRRNLFLSTVGEFETAINPVYRYHDLFARFLRHRLAQWQPGRVKELHRRAGDAETLPARVVRHYVAAEAWEQAAATIGSLGLQLLAEGQIERLHEWILALPEDFAARRPWLNYLMGMCRAEEGEFLESERYLEKALQQFREEGNQEGETKALSGLAYCASGRHNFEQVARLLDQVLEKPLSPGERVRSLMGRVWLMYYQENWAQVDLDTTTAMQIALSTDDPDAIAQLARTLTPGLMVSNQGLGPIERYHRAILSRLDERPSMVRAGTLAALGLIGALRGDRGQAVEMAREAHELSARFGGLLYMDVMCDLVLLTEALALEDYAAFERRWQARESAYEQTGARQWLILYLHAQAAALWLQGRGEELRALVERVEGTEIASEPPESIAARQLILSMWRLHEGAYQKAEAILLDVVDAQRRSRAARGWLDARFLLAHLYLEWKRPEDALALMKPLLTELGQRKIPGYAFLQGPHVVPLLRLAVENDVQVEVAIKALAMFERPQVTRPVTIPGTDETLTPREVQVLELLMTGATNKEIAAELVFTVRTAKAHVSSILRKLGVSSRTEAVARAHELSLLAR